MPSQLSTPNEKVDLLYNNSYSYSTCADPEGGTGGPGPQPALSIGQSLAHKPNAILMVFRCWPALFTGYR